MILTQTDNLPIRHAEDVHSGKVRSVYWLPETDSRRVICQEDFPVASDTQLGVMVISDRISAFDVNWGGIPGKGASLNAVTEHYFREFAKRGIAGNHILARPHPMVWIVQRAQPVMVEAIGRQYITGSMWRSYERGEREFCGHSLAQGLAKNQRLDELLITPTTKGIMKGIPGVPEEDDVDLTMRQIQDNYGAFGFHDSADIQHYQQLLRKGFATIATLAADAGQILVDTKFEFGYVSTPEGQPSMIFIDEAGTPDSSRYWDRDRYQRDGVAVENSKEGFRQFLLDNVPERDVLLDKGRMPERRRLAAEFEVPGEMRMDVAETYTTMAERLTGRGVPPVGEDPRTEIIATLTPYGIVD